MSSYDKSILPNITRRFKTGNVKQLIIDKIVEVNTDVPSNFEWDDFDISVKVYIGDEAYLQDKKTCFILRIKEDSTIKEKYKSRRITIPEEGIEFTSDLITLNKVLDDLGFNKTFPGDAKDDVQDILENQLNLNTIITTHEDSNSIEQFYLANESMTTNDSIQVITLSDTKRDGDDANSDKFSALLSIKNNRTNDDEPLGYCIRFNS